MAGPMVRFTFGKAVLNRLSHDMGTTMPINLFPFLRVKRHEGLRSHRFVTMSFQIPWDAIQFDGKHL